MLKKQVCCDTLQEHCKNVDSEDVIAFIENRNFYSYYILVILYWLYSLDFSSHFYRAMLAQSAVMRLHVVCLSVRL